MDKENARTYSKKTLDRDWAKIYNCSKSGAENFLALIFTNWH